MFGRSFVGSFARRSAAQTFDCDCVVCIDLKPRDIVRVGSSWKLMGFDSKSAVKIGDIIRGSRSTGFVVRQDVRVEGGGQRQWPHDGTLLLRVWLVETGMPHQNWSDRWRAGEG